MNKAHAITVRHCDARVQAWPEDLRAWLSAAELDELAHWHHPRRRDAWLAGRWLLKLMLSRPAGRLDRETFESELSDVEILSRDANGRGRTPRVLRDGRALTCHASLAHAGDAIWAAISDASHVRVGIDVIADRPLNRGACELWLTRREREQLLRTDERIGPAIWAVKEAVYKATNRGEPFDPAGIEVARDPRGRWGWTWDGAPQRNGDRLDVAWVGGCIVAIAAVGLESPPEDPGHD